MGKRKKKQFASYESSAVVTDRQEPYIALTNSLMNNKNWLSLKPTSQILYCYMKMWSKGSNKVQYSYSLAQKIIGSSRTVSNCLKELKEKGFIRMSEEATNNKGIIYEFIDEWYKKDWYIKK